MIPLGKAEEMQSILCVFLHEKTGRQELYFNSKPAHCEFFVYLFHPFVASMRIARGEKHQN